MGIKKQAKNQKRKDFLGFDLIHEIYNLLQHIHIKRSRANLFSVGNGFQIV